MELDTDSAAEPLFRPVKRRKFIRKRQDDNDEHGTAAQAASTPPIPLSPSATPGATEEDEANDQISVADLLRIRKNQKARKGGIEFVPLARQAGLNSNALTTQEAEEERLKAIEDRFVGQSGSIVDVDKHMVAYVESEMAKRRLGAASASSGGGLSNTTDSSRSHNNPPPLDSKFATAARQPASLGKLHEIDLGPDATLRNIQRTEAAARRLDGEAVLDATEEDANKKPKKPRLGPDGKPWRSRKRRTSEDLKRDQLVEDILRESRLSLYDSSKDDALNEADDATATQHNSDPEAADDRIAEQFRRDFMDAIQSRRRRAPKTVAKPKPGQPGAAQAEVARGPKLGGSRQARAAMREAMEKEQQKGGVRR